MPSTCISDRDPFRIRSPYMQSTRFMARRSSHRHLGSAVTAIAPRAHETSIRGTDVQSMADHTSEILLDCANKLAFRRGG
jgi:hypothetical protein